MLTSMDNKCAHFSSISYPMINFDQKGWHWEPLSLGDSNYLLQFDFRLGKLRLVSKKKLDFFNLASLAKGIRDQPWPSGYDNWLSSVSRRFESSLGPQHSGLAWSLYKWAALWRTVYDLSATKRPLETIRKEKRISFRFQVSFSSRYNLSC